MFGLYSLCYMGWNSKPTNTSELTINIKRKPNRILIINLYIINPGSLRVLIKPPFVDPSL